jgi:hypothetical protein
MRTMTSWPGRIILIAKWKIDRESSEDENYRKEVLVYEHRSNVIRIKHHFTHHESQKMISRIFY